MRLRKRWMETEIGKEREKENETQKERKRGRDELR